MRSNGHHSVCYILLPLELVCGCFQPSSPPPLPAAQPLPPIPPLSLPEVPPPATSSSSKVDADKYPCKYGPLLLQGIDEGSVTVDQPGFPPSSAQIEQLAELLITKCSEELTWLALAAAAISDPQTRRMWFALQAFDQQKLDYMK